MLQISKQFTTAMAPSHFHLDLGAHRKYLLLVSSIQRKMQGSSAIETPAQHILSIYDTAQSNNPAVDNRSHHERGTLP